MIKTIAILSAVLVTFLATPARAQHEHGAPSAGQDHSMPATTGKLLPAPAQPVVTQYLKIQTALAADSVDGVAAAAQAITKALADDPNKTLPATIGTRAEALSKAKNLEVARAAFKDLSVVLLRYLGSEKIRTGQYHVVYCDMAKANWLQTDRAIRNPYYGKEMLTCGKIIESF